MAALENVISKTRKTTHTITDNPEKFLEVQKKVASQLCKTTKDIYDGTKSTEVSTPSSTLPELLIDNFDDEQIWQEVDLQNSHCITEFLKSVSHLSASKNVSFRTSSASVTDDARHRKKGKKASERISQKDSVKFSEEEEGELLDSASDSASEDNADLRLDKYDLPSDEESEEEKEMKRLLEKSQALSENEEEDSEEDDLDFDFDIESQNKKSKKSKGQTQTASIESSDNAKDKPKKRKTVVDDKFFKLADLEDFLDQEDRREERRLKREQEGAQVEESSSEEEGEVDMFADFPSDGEEIHYADFFDPPEDENDVEGSPNKKPKMEEDADMDDNDEEEDNESEADEDEDVEEHLGWKREGEIDEDSEESEGEDVADIFGGERGKPQQALSTFEKRQQKLQDKIKKLEDANLEDKPWQLQGEIASSARPENSLLQEDLDFEQTTRLAPVITEETTQKLDDLIKQRIKDKAWDDVERKEKPKENATDYRRRLVLDQEKSKMSLSQVYEEEFLKQTQQEEEEAQDPKKEEIYKMMTSLFVKLDALSNFHYTPKPAAPEVKIVSNLPSVTMEEVAPTSVSDAAQLAPEEIQGKPKAEPKGNTERTATDKKRARREKKKRQGERRKEREQREKKLDKLKPGLGNKYSKEKAMKELEQQSKSSKGLTVLKEEKGQKKSGLTSSNKFFTQLQEEVTTLVQSKKAANKKQKLQKDTSAKFKL